MNTMDNVPLNRHIESFKDVREEGAIPHSDQYSIYTQTIDSSDWGGRNVNFTVDNLGMDKLIKGSRCFLRFICTATKNDNSNIATGDPIELREGAGNLLIENAQIMIANTNVHNDNFSVITRHFYERLANSNHDRVAGTEADRYIGGDASAFGIATDTLVTPAGIRKTAISEGKEFMISRPLTEMSFFGPRDTSIPGLLPITMNFTLNSQPARLFQTDATITAAPKLKITTVELHVYTMKMDETYVPILREQLRSGNLLASCDNWATQSVGNTVAANQSTFAFPSDITIATTPDVLGIAFLPESTYNATNAYKGKHPLTTSWLNISDAQLESLGVQIRQYRQLGNSAAVGKKEDLSREVSQFSGRYYDVGLGRSSIDLSTFSGGSLSFFPLALRSIDDTNVLNPKPFSIKMNATMSGTAGEAASSYVFYKVRHQWVLSAEPGRTSIMK